MKLAEHDIDVRLTTTKRVGIHEYTFNKEGSCNVILDLDHRDKLIGDGMSFKGKNMIVGKRISKAWANEQHIYFAIETSKEIVSHEYNAEDDPSSSGSTKLALKFNLKKGEKSLEKRRKKKRKRI